MSPQSRRALLRAGLALLGSAPLLASAQGSSTGPIKLALIESLSGPFANTGEAVFRNLGWAIERVNARGGVPTAGGRRPLQLVRYDNKGQVEESLSMLRAAIDDGAQFVAQGNSSAVAAALIDAINKHNERAPAQRVLFLNYSAVDPILTNELCSFWHFRFDAHADMRMAALMEVIKADERLKSMYLIGQDYSFGHAVLREARRQLGTQRPDVAIAGEELHPIGRIKDFLPYVTKIRNSGAQAVLTGNWGNDLTLLIKALREVGVEARIYSFYGNALGAPAAIGEAGVGRVLAVAEWHPNVDTPASRDFHAAFRARFPKPEEDYQHARMQVMVEMLAAAIERAGSTEAGAVARALEGLRYDGRTLGGLHSGSMRAADHQFIQPLVVSVMDKLGAPGVRVDNEGSGYGFRTLRAFDAKATEQAHRCSMERP